MYYEIKGIKQIGGESVNINILVENDNEKFIRDFLSEKNILVLSIIQFKNQIENFGNYYIITENEKKEELKIILSKTFRDIEKSCEFLIEIGIKIIKINNFKNDISQENIDKIISEKLKKINKEKEKKSEEKDEKKRKQKKIYRDDEMEKVQEIINLLFENIEKYKEKIKGYVKPRKLKMLTDEVEMLKKIRMGSNIIKTKEKIGKILYYMDEVLKDYWDIIDENEELIIDKSIVSDLDVVIEEYKNNKAKLIKILKIKGNNTDKYYIFFQELGIYLKLLKQDIKYCFSKFNNVLYKFMSFLVFVSLLLCIQIAVYIWIDSTMYLNNNLEYIYLIMIYTGVLGFILNIMNSIKKNNSIYLIVQFIVSMILYFFVIRLIILNLSF